MLYRLTLYWAVRLGLTSLFILTLLGTGTCQRRPYQMRPEEPGYLRVHLSVGAANYQGDLNERTALRPGQIGLTFGAGGTYRLTNHVLARGDLRFIRLQGSQQGTPRADNNLSFRSTNPELTGSVMLELLPAYIRPVVNPYLMVGAGLTYLSPQTRYQNEWVRLPQLNTEGADYSRIAVLLYGGAGLAVRLSRHWQVGFEVTYALPSSDYLDDVSGTYPFASSLRNTEAANLTDRRPELGLPPAQPGSQRGYASGTDTYLTGQIRISRAISSAKERQARRNVNCIR